MDNNIGDLASSVFFPKTTTHRTIGAFNRRLSADLCGVDLGLSSLSTTKHIKKHRTKALTLTDIANNTTQYTNICVIN